MYLDANQILIMNKGGGRLLANLAYKTNDMQTLRMVAGAIANLCGNGTYSSLRSLKVFLTFPFLFLMLQNIIIMLFFANSNFLFYFSLCIRKCYYARYMRNNTSKKN